PLLDQIRRSPRPTLLPYTTLFRSSPPGAVTVAGVTERMAAISPFRRTFVTTLVGAAVICAPLAFTDDTDDGSELASPGALSPFEDRKSTRLNSSHVKISYAVFCLK